MPRSPTSNDSHKAPPTEWPPYFEGLRPSQRLIFWRCQSLLDRSHADRLRHTSTQLSHRTVKTLKMLTHYGAMVARFGTVLALGGMECLLKPFEHKDPDRWGRFQNWLSAKATHHLSRVGQHLSATEHLQHQAPLHDLIKNTIANPSSLALPVLQEKVYAFISDWVVYSYHHPLQAGLADDPTIQYVLKNHYSRPPSPDFPSMLRELLQANFPLSGQFQPQAHLMPFRDVVSSAWNAAQAQHPSYYSEDDQSFMTNLARQFSSEKEACVLYEATRPTLTGLEEQEVSATNISLSNRISKPSPRL